MRVLPFISDEQPVRVQARSLNMFAHATARVGALVVAARVDVALDHLLAILPPPGHKQQCGTAAFDQSHIYAWWPSHLLPSLVIVVQRECTAAMSETISCKFYHAGFSEPAALSLRHARGGSEYLGVHIPTGQDALSLPCLHVDF